MKPSEILTESYIAPGIYDELEAKGYTRLGRGQDQAVFLEPGTGMVLKIFGIRDSRNPTNGFTPAQKTFVRFAEFCQDHQKNEFLPQVSGWETFMFDGRMYLQIRMERLFDIHKGASRDTRMWGHVLQDMASEAVHGDSDDDKRRWYAKQVEAAADEDEVPFESLMSHLGWDGFCKLWDTIYMLWEVSSANGFSIDLHDENFMLGSDGHIVISDPYFSGWGNQ